MAAPPLSEDSLIATFFAPMAGPGGLGLLDDAALVSVPADHELVLTTDALVEGMHFLSDDPPDTVARKALRVNLSDLAAKGADPLGFLLSLALPSGWTTEWLSAFAAGLAEDGATFACPLAGGDTVKTPGPLTLSITAFGTVPRGSMVPRTGARPGDRLYVSGTIGDGVLGLRVRRDNASDAAWIGRLDGGARAALVDRYRLPQPRTALRHALRRHANAGMDVSDGLIGDLAKMLRVSGVSAEVDLSRVPLSPAARAAIRLDPSLFEAAVTGGDDYEILSAVASEQAIAFEAAAALANIPVTMIGTADDRTGEPPVFRDTDGSRRQFARGSFSHF